MAVVMVGSADSMVISKILVVDKSLASVAWAVKLKVNSATGIPVSIPSLLRLQPAGRSTEDHV